MRSCWSGTSWRSTPSSAPGGGFEIVKKEVADGWATMRVRGADALDAFRDETGGHRWQRIPPNERHGRVHTSTVTVTVLETDASKRPDIILRKEDVEISYMRGSGKGGQHRNKTDTACRMKHIPTGEVVRCENERSQAANRDAAWKELQRRLQKKADDERSVDVSRAKQQQAGSGMRGDKRRTYREQDDIVTDHVTSKKASLRSILQGELELLR